MNVLYRHIRALLCALCLLVCASAQTANVYPISLTASLLPPYSNCLGDYMSGSMDRVNVMAVMKDMSNPTGVYDIQLRMVVRQGNTRYIEASAKPHNSVTFSVARDGRMKRLANAGRLLDPANATISYSRYAKNGYCLPEGAYQIEFQAFDNRFPTLPLSEPYTLHVYLGETEPPVPVYPANNTCVPNTSGQITFSWMERTVPHISPTKKYRLQVFEVPAGAATNAVAVSEPYKRVDEVVGGTTTFATIQQTAGTFVSGHTYVWRVRSFDDADKDNNTSLRYKNQGWSDTASFRFDRCLDEGFGIVEAEGECDDLARPAIAGVETSADAALVEWTADSGSATPPDRFRIAYCLAGDSLGLWTSFDKHTGDLATLAGTGGTTVYALPLRGLEPGVAYRVRVCAVRSGADGTAACHSEADSAEFRMPLAAGTVLADCDRSVPALQCTTALTKENAPKAGDHINANGQDVKILSIEAKGEGADTRFSGQGTTTFPFLKNKLSLLVDFRDIQISCANELMKGEIVTHWDPEHNANLDFNALLNNNNMGTGPAPQQKQFTSGDTATLKSGIAYVEKGANTGDVYAVGADGKVEKVGESLECTGVSTSALDYEAGTVVFSPGDGQLPPFDRNSGKFQNADIRNYYTRYGTYDVPWVAVVSGKTATLRASFNANTDGTPVDTSKIYFVCKTQYQTVKLKSRKLSGGQYEVTVFGDKPQERLDIYAMCADTSGNCLKALTLGKALVMTMAQRRETLVLVPVGQNAPKVDTAAIKRTLDGIYLPLGVDYTVRADNPFYTSELDGLLEEGLGITGAGLFKEETDDMRYLQSLYRQERSDSIDNTAAYIFILPKASVDGVKGDMPLTRPVGYVFASGDTYADGQTIAHELGHGLYSFQHAFDYMGVSQGETDNLMDYGLPQGEKLAVWQWNLISTHKNYTIPFLTDDEDGWIKGSVSESPLYFLIEGEEYRYSDLYEGNPIGALYSTLLTGKTVSIELKKSEQEKYKDYNVDFDKLVWKLNGKVLEKSDKFSAHIRELEISKKFLKKGENKLCIYSCDTEKKQEKCISTLIITYYNPPYVKFLEPKDYKGEFFIDLSFNTIKESSLHDKTLYYEQYKTIEIDDKNKCFVPVVGTKMGKRVSIPFIFEKVDNRMCYDRKFRVMFKSEDSITIYSKDIKKFNKEGYSVVFESKFETEDVFIQKPGTSIPTSTKIELIIPSIDKVIGELEVYSIKEKKKTVDIFNVVFSEDEKFSSFDKSACEAYLNNQSMGQLSLNFSLNEQKLHVYESYYIDKNLKKFLNQEQHDYLKNVFVTKKGWEEQFKQAVLRGKEKEIKNKIREYLKNFSDSTQYELKIISCKLKIEKNKNELSKKGISEEEKGILNSEIADYKQQIESLKKQQLKAQSKEYNKSVDYFFITDLEFGYINGFHKTGEPGGVLLKSKSLSSMYSTCSHEFGHWLGLGHPFYRIENMPTIETTDFDVVTFASHTGSNFMDYFVNLKTWFAYQYRYIFR